MEICESKNEECEMFLNANEWEKEIMEKKKKKKNSSLQTKKNRGSKMMKKK
jgi:hypothetical protein